MSHGLLALALVSVGIGLFYGGFVATLPAVVMDIFGGRAVSAIIGWLYTAPGIGTLLGPPLAGYGFDRLGSYDAPILGAAPATRNNPPPQAASSNPEPAETITPLAECGCTAHPQGLSRSVT